MIRKASLGTLFFTVFLDLVGFGLVVPYLPGVARNFGASDLVATLLGAVYSLMQLFFVPFWGQLSDRVGRRPILLASTMASVIGFLILGSAGSLGMLFVARIWNGIATSNISVAQAYIADVTTPENRAKGMGLIGASIGLGFVLGPVLGGQLVSISQTYGILPEPGALPAYAGAALSGLNVLLAYFFLPESLPEEKRGTIKRRTSPFDLGRYRIALAFPGTGVALLIHFAATLSFASMEQTFRLFTEDEFHMSDRSTGYVLGFVGLTLILVQGGLMRPLARVAAERTLVRVGLVIQVVGFAALACSPRLSGIGMLYASMGVIALGSALTNPSLSAFVSKCGDVKNQGVVLGVLQSAGAFARVCGPATGGVLYQTVGPVAPYFAAALGMTIASTISLRMPTPGSVVEIEAS